MTSTKKEILKYILYIYYLNCFQNNNSNIKTLIYFNSEVNIIASIYTLKLSFKV